MDEGGVMKTKSYHDCLDIHLKSRVIDVWIDELWDIGELLVFVFIEGACGMDQNLYIKAHNLLDEGI